MSQETQQQLSAIVTGASSGIGYELAKIAKKQGYHVILVARNEEKLKELQREIGGGQIIVQDLAVPDAAVSIFEQVKDKTIELLINNAGFGDYGKFCHADWPKLSDMIQVNITALTQLAHLFLPQMIGRNSGRILNVASTASFQPGPLMATYYATKSYVLHFSEAIANELSDTKVTVTALCPGPTESSFQETAQMGNLGGKQPSSKQVADYGYKAMIKGKRVAIYGWKNFLLASSYRYMPRGLLLTLIRKFQASRK